MSVSCSKDQENLYGNWIFQKGTGNAVYLTGKTASLSFRDNNMLLCVYESQSQIKTFKVSGNSLYINDASMSYPIKFSCKKNSLVIYSNITDLYDPANPDNGTVYYTK